jgi:hypothetical protein
MSSSLCCHAEGEVVSSRASPTHLLPEIWKCPTIVLIYVWYAFTWRDSGISKISFALTDLTNMRFWIFNLRGESITTLIQMETQPYCFMWALRTRKCLMVTSGFHFLVILLCRKSLPQSVKCLDEQGFIFTILRATFRQDLGPSSLLCNVYEWVSPGDVGVDWCSECEKLHYHTSQTLSWFGSYLHGNCSQLSIQA